MKRLLVILGWLVLGGATMVSDQYRMVERQRVVYTGTITIGRLRFTANSFNGYVVQIAGISEREPKHDLQIPTNVDCPCGYHRAFNPTTTSGYFNGGATTALSPAQMEDCEPEEEAPQGAAVHQIEIPKDEIPQVIDVLNHFRKELTTAQNAVVDDGAKP